MVILPYPCHLSYTVLNIEIKLTYRHVNLGTFKAYKGFGTVHSLRYLLKIL